MGLPQDERFSGEVNSPQFLQILHKPPPSVFTGLTVYMCLSNGVNGVIITAVGFPTRHTLFFRPPTSARQKRVVPELNEEFAQSIRKDLTMAELTAEVEKAVMEETGTSKKDARNRSGGTIEIRQMNPFLLCANRSVLVFVPDRIICARYRAHQSVISGQRRPFVCMTGCSYERLVDVLKKLCYCCCAEKQAKRCLSRMMHG